MLLYINVNRERMDIIIKKVKGTEKFIVWMNGEKSDFSVTKNNFGSECYYLIYKGQRLKRRAENREEVITYFKTYLLEKRADLLLGKK